MQILRPALLVLLAFYSGTSEPARLHLEKWYQERWCVNGQTEYVLPDLARVDCLTDEYAVEADFADKWAESIGQALYYASQTGRKPGILMIVEQDSDCHYLFRLYQAILAAGVPVRVWIIRP